MEKENIFFLLSIGTLLLIGAMWITTSVGMDQSLSLLSDIAGKYGTADLTSPLTIPIPPDNSDSNGACEITNGVKTGKCVYKKGANECNLENNYGCVTGRCALVNGSFKCDPNGIGFVCNSEQQQACNNYWTYLGCNEKNQCAPVSGAFGVYKKCQTYGSLTECKDVFPLISSDGACEITNGVKTGKCVYKKDANECGNVGGADIACLKQK